MEECKSTIAPILAHSPDSNGLASMHWTKWEKQEAGFDKFTQIYHHHSSFVLPDGAITPEVTDKIFDLIQNSPALVPSTDGSNKMLNKNHILWDNIGGATTTVGAKDTAFFWRDGVYVLTCKVQWSDPSQEVEAYAWATRCKEVLTPYCVKGKAAYLNYIDATLEDWQAAYYGENYQRLQLVKSSWDPTNFFYFKQSVELLCKDDQSQKLWQNWGESVTASPREVLAPTSMDELVEIVHRARKRHGRIRVVGSGHSWSPLVPCNDTLVSMAGFTDISISDDKTAVTVQPGLTIDQFASFLIQSGVCIPSNVGHGVGEATIGGVVSTGCHGSGITMSSTSDYVVALTILTSRGQFVTFDNSNEEMLNAARISLGLFGIITSMTFRVEPSYNVHVVDFPQQVDDALEGLRDFVKGNEYAEFSWIPFTTTAYMNKANKTSDSITRQGQDPTITSLKKKENKALAENAVFTLLSSPDQTPQVCRENMELMPYYDYVANITDYLHNSDYYSIMQSKVADIEIIFDIDDGFNSVKKCFMLFKESVEAWATSGLYPMNGSLGFRFIKNSDCTISPARGNTYSCLAELTSFFKTNLFEQFSGELCKAWIRELPNARPHWAKGFQFMPNARLSVRQSYGTQLSEFWQLRKEANVDPDNLFTNDYLLSIFEGEEDKAEESHG